MPADNAGGIIGIDLGMRVYIYFIYLIVLNVVLLFTHTHEYYGGRLFMAKKSLASEKSTKMIRDAARQLGFDPDKSSDRRKICNRLKEAGCGVDELTLRRWVEGKCFPQGDNGYALCSVLNIDSESFFSAANEQATEQKSCFSGSLRELSEQLPLVIKPIHQYGWIFPCREAWEHLIAKKMMKTGYMVAATPTVAAFRSQAYADYQLRCLAECGIDESEISSLIMWFGENEVLPNNLIEASPTVVKKYVDLAFAGIRNADKRAQDARARQNMSGDYIDGRLDGRLNADNLYFYLGKALQLNTGEWFPVDYRFNCLSEGMKEKARQECLKKAGRYVMEGNVLGPIEHYCLGMHEYGSAYASVFTSFFEVKDVEGRIDGVIDVKMARIIPDAVREYIKWYEDMKKAIIDWK